MNARIRRSTIAAVAALVLPFSVMACGSDDSDSSSDDSTAAGEETPGQDDSDKSEEGDEKETASEPFGPGCEAVPESGDGSFDGMAKDPVATAAGNNPALSTLVKAVGAADLGDTLNSAEDITVFAPTNDAFDKIPKADLDALLKDKDALSKVLTHHVVDERLAPKDLEDGEYATLAKEKLTVAGSGEKYEVNDDSKVVCGNVQTSNATVYIVDTVLMPAK